MNGTTRNVETCERQQEKHLGNFHKQYKHLLLTKEKEYKLKCRKELESNIGDPKQFWRSIKKFTLKTRQVSDISDEQWLEHFEKVFDVKLMMKYPLHTPQKITGIVTQKMTL